MTAQLLTIVIIVIDVSGGLSERTMGQPFLFVWGFIIIIIIIMHPLTNRVSIMRMTNRRQPKCIKFRKYVQNYSQRCLSEKQITVQLPGVPTPASSFAGDFAAILQNGLCLWAFWFLPSLLILPVFCEFLDPPLLVIHELSAFAVALCCQKIEPRKER